VTVPAPFGGCGAWGRKSQSVSPPQPAPPVVMPVPVVRVVVEVAIDAAPRPRGWRKAATAWTAWTAAKDIGQV